MKRLLVFVLGMSALTAVASSTPVDEMIKQGFSCDQGSRGDVVCKKAGSPSKVCNTEGSCFRIVYESSAAVDKKMITGSVIGHGYSNTEY
jgi:hypothetical protein